MNNQSNTLYVIIDPSGAQSGAASTVQAINSIVQSASQLNVSVTQVTNNIQRSMDTNARNVGNLKKAVKSLTDDFSRLGALLAAAQPVNMFKSFMSSIADADRSYNGFIAMMNVTTGSITKSKEEFDFVTRAANTFGVKLDGLAASYAKLSAATKGLLTETNTKQLFTAITAVSSVMHAESYVVERMFNAIIQMASKGQVHMEELKQQLGEHLPGAMALAATSINMSVGDMIDAMKKGDISARKLLTNLPKTVIDTFGKAAEISSQSLHSTFNRFNTAIELVLIKLSTNGIAVGLAAVFRELTNHIETASPAFVMLSNIIGNALVDVSEYIKRLKPEDIATFAESVINATKAIILMTGSFVDMLAWGYKNSDLIISLATGFAGLRLITIGYAASVAAASASTMVAAGAFTALSYAIGGAGAYLLGFAIGEWAKREFPIVSDWVATAIGWFNKIPVATAYWTEASYTYIEYYVERLKGKISEGVNWLWTHLKNAGAGIARFFGVDVEKAIPQRYEYHLTVKARLDNLRTQYDSEMSKIDKTIESMIRENNSESAKSKSELDIFARLNIDRKGLDSAVDFFAKLEKNLQESQKLADDREKKGKEHKLTAAEKLLEDWKTVVDQIPTDINDKFSPATKKYAETLNKIASGAVKMSTHQLEMLANYAYEAQAREHNNSLLEAENKLREDRTKFFDTEFDAATKEVESVSKTNEAIRERINAYGKAKEATLEYKAAQALLQRELELTAESELRSAAETLNSSGVLSQVAFEYLRLADLHAKKAKDLGTQATLYTEEAYQKSLNESRKAFEKFFDDIERGLTDSIYRSFEKGESFGKTFIESLKKLFKTSALKLMVQAVVDPASAYLKTAIGLGGSNSGVASLGSVASTGNSLYNAFTGSNSLYSSFATSNIGQAIGLSSAVGSGMASIGAIGSGVSATGGMVGLAANATGAGLSVGSGLGAGVLSGSTLTGGATTAIGSAAPTLTGLGSTIGTALPWIGAALAVASLFGSKKPKPATLELYNNQQMNAAEFGQTHNVPAIDTAFGTLAFSGKHLDKNGIDINKLMDEQLKPIAAVDQILASVMTASQLKSARSGLVNWSAMDVYKGDDAGDPLERRLSEILNPIDGWIGQLLDTVSGSIDEKYTQAISALSAQGYEKGQEIADQLFAGVTDGLNEGETLAAAFGRIAGALQVINPLFEDLGLKLFDISTIGGDAASDLINLYGGLEALQSAFNSYYDNYYSAEEKRANVVKKITRTLSQAGAIVDEATVATATREQFRAAYEAIVDASGAASPLAVALMSVESAFAGITASADEASSSSDSLADALKEVSDRQIEWAKNAYESAKDATDAAFNALERSIDAQKTSIGLQIDVASELINSLKSLTSVIDSGMATLLSASTSVNMAGQSVEFIKQSAANAITSGYLPDADELQKAIEQANNGLDQSNFDSAFEQERMRLRILGDLRTIQSVSGPKLSAAEQQLTALKSQLVALDAILENAKLQLDQARGVDTSLLSIETALLNLQNAIVNELKLQTKAFVDSIFIALRAGNISPSDAISQLNNAGAGVKTETESQVDTINGKETIYASSGGAVLVKNPNDPANSLIYGNDATQTSISDAIAFVNEVQRRVSAGIMSSEDGIRAVYSEAVKKGISSTSLDAMMGWAPGSSLYAVQAIGLPSFDVGTNVVPHDMIAQIHEDEAIIPKRFNPWAGGELPNQGNKEIAQAINTLNSKFDVMKKDFDVLNGFARRTANAVNGQPESPMLVIVED